MSIEEKRTWIYAVVAVAVSAVYFAVILRQVPGADVSKIAYVGPMLTAIGVAVVANIVANIAVGVVAAIASPKEAGLKDERDRQIDRLGDRVGFYVVSVLALAPLGLAMAEAKQFWIANALYLAFVLAAFASSVVKIVAYRRGL